MLSETSQSQILFDSNYMTRLGVEFTEEVQWYMPEAGGGAWSRCEWRRAPGVGDQKSCGQVTVRAAQR